jgi:hypothetical protein
MAEHRVPHHMAGARGPCIDQDHAPTGSVPVRKLREILLRAPRLANFADGRPLADWMVENRDEKRHHYKNQRE